MDFIPFAAGKLTHTTPSLIRKDGTHFWQTTIRCQGDWKNTPDGNASIAHVIEAVKHMIRIKQFPPGTLVDYTRILRKGHVTHDPNEITLSVIIMDKNHLENSKNPLDKVLLERLDDFLNNTLKASLINTKAVVR